MSKDKVKKCEFCGNELPENGVCRVCGQALFSGLGVFYFGQTRREYYAQTEIVLTGNGYLIVRKSGSGAGSAVGAASFGALGALVGGLADAAMRSANPRAYYDMTEISVVENPCPMKGYKPERVFRFVSRDGRDFLLGFQKKPAQKFAEALGRVGIRMTDMSASEKSKTACRNLLVDKKTFDRRVCASVGRFIELRSDQFMAESVVDSNQ
ncbi:MAG: hypothetical protein LUG23_00290 [Oscillospiraceae bacterium]|nr:hypothetical protein [Oscillospiraceae bacterium]